LLCAAHLLLGVLCCLTVRGIPLGLKCFRLSVLSLWPVGRRVVSTDLVIAPPPAGRGETLRPRKADHNGRIDRSTNVPPAAAR
jgi:hypothetical protein